MSGDSKSSLEKEDIKPKKALQRSHGPGEKLMDRTAPVWIGNIEGREDLSTSITASSASMSA